MLNVAGETRPPACEASVRKPFHDSPVTGLAEIFNHAPR